MKLSRREFLKAFGYFLISLAGASFGGYGYATRVEPKWLTVERVRVSLEGMKSAFEGLKIVQLSDIHLHPFTQIDLIEKAVEIANSLQPDIIVLTGDYVLERADSIFELAPVLAGLNAAYGTYSILGNHDLWTDADVILRGLEEVGIPVLINRGLILNIEGEQLFLAGLDDGWSGHPDLDTALENCPANTPVILLMHEPDFVDSIAQDERVSLQLSGHTHGGQVRLPGVGPIALPDFGRKYDIGLHKVNQTMLYVNRGLGVIGPPVRFNCRPEITEITLVAPKLSV